VCTLLNTDKYAYLAGLKWFTMKPEELTIIKEDRKKFYSYESNWEHTFFDEKTGGYLVTELQRKYKPMTKNDEESFLKEQRMGMKYASFGFQIEHINELPGVSSPDAYIRRHGNGAIVVNGQLADFKSTKSANNIVKYAKYAIRNQGAELVMFEFTDHPKGITDRIKSLTHKEIHGYYYYSDQNEFEAF